MKKNTGFQILRGILICCVVLFHALSIFEGDYAGHIQQYSSFASGLRSVIGTFQMPLFMALSGYLFYNTVLRYMEDGEYNAKQFIIKKFKRLIVPFILIMFLWRKPLLLVGNRESLQINNPTQLLHEYLKTTTAGGLWFLYVLFALFVLHYLAIKIIWKSKKGLLSFICMSFFLSAFSTFLSGPIHHLMMYNIYFALGAFLHFQHFSFKDKYLASSLCLCIFLSLLYAFGLVKNALMSSVLFTINATLYIITVLPYFRDLKQRNASLEKLGKNSMGIYLLHEPLMICIGSFLPSTIKGGY